MFWILILIRGLNSEIVSIGSFENSVDLLEDTSESISLEMKLGSYSRDKLLIAGKEYYSLALEGEGLILDKGAPQLPTLARSLIIDDYSSYTLDLVASEFIDVNLAIAPSKGVLTRDIDPNSIPFEFGQAYKNDKFYPDSITNLSSPYIMRNLRGLTVKFNPIQYNPVSGITRIYTSIKVKLMKSKSQGINILTRKAQRNSSFDFIQRNHFLNYSEDRYESLSEVGSMMIIAPANYFNTLQPFVNWKRDKGIRVSLIDVATIGNDSNLIKTSIQNYYNNDNNLTYVLLVGDANQLASPSVSGGGSDPSYSLVAGDDSYPDILIGRFSAENTSQLATQVERTIAYERDINSTVTHLNKAIGIASSQGGVTNGDMGESDIEHMNLIREDLLAYNYTSVDRIYDPSASASNVASALEEGRAFVNYVGHGSTTSWGTTGFSNSHINNLSNVEKLPFIVSVACVNGNFVSNTCFAEAWLRATNNGDPSGAIAIYASSINQSWNSPMRAQDEITDLLVSEQLTTIGGLFYSGSCQMIDTYGTDGIEMFKTWNIFGDPSLQVRTNTPQEIIVEHSGSINSNSLEYTVNTNTENALVSLTYDHEILGTGYTSSTGSITLQLEELPVNIVDLTLTVTAFNKSSYQAPVTMLASDGAFVTIESTPSSILFNHNGDFSLSIQNSGSQSASELTLSLTSSSPYVIINDAVERVMSLEVGEIISLSQDAFDIRIINNPPNDEIINFNLYIANNNNSWDDSFNLQTIAPDFEIGTVDYSELVGNSDNMIQSGESIKLEVPVLNHSNLTLSNIPVTININSLNAQVSERTFIIESLPANSSQQCEYFLSIADYVTNNAELNVSINVDYRDYSESDYWTAYINLNAEDFESLDLAFFNWQTTGGDYIFTSDAYDGSYSLQSPDINNDDVTSISTEYASTQDGNISFFLKTSTESNYDFVRFYIDNVEYLETSGNSNWQEYSYPVSEGNHVYKWEYVKDYIVSSYNDCFYLDNISFPGNNLDSHITPTTPNNISIQVSENTTRLTWEASEYATYYRILASDNINGDYVILQEVSETSCTFSNDSRYKFFKIIASN